MSITHLVAVLSVVISAAVLKITTGKNRFPRPDGPSSLFLASRIHPHPWHIFRGFLARNKLIILHFTLLFATPWLFILLLGNPLHSPSSFSCNGASKNFSCLISAEYIFFEGEQNIHHRLGDYQFLLPSFIPLVLIGIYKALSGKNNKQKLLLIVVPALLLLGFLNLDKNFFVILLFVMILSIFTTIGAAAIIANFKKLSLLLKTLAAFELFWVLYETLRMYQIIIVNKPFITS